MLTKPYGDLANLHFTESADPPNAVYAQGRYVAAGGTEKEALVKQAELRGKVARGEPVTVPARVQNPLPLERILLASNAMVPTSADKMMFGRRLATAMPIWALVA